MVQDETNSAGVPDPSDDAQPMNQDASGRFLPGNKLSAGNNQRMIQRRCAQYRKAMFAAVSDDNMQEIARAMVALACQGDVAAAKLVWDQCLGKMPEASVEVDSSSTPGQLVINLVSPNVKN